MANNDKALSLDDSQIAAIATRKAEVPPAGRTSIDLRRDATALKKLGKTKEAAQKYAEAALRSEVDARADLYVQLCTELDSTLGASIAARLKEKRANAEVLKKQGTRNPNEM